MHNNDLEYCALNNRSFEKRRESYLVTYFLFLVLFLQIVILGGCVCWCVFFSLKMNDFNAIYKEFSEETHCYHYIIRKVGDVCLSLMSKTHFSHVMSTDVLTVVYYAQYWHLWIYRPIKGKTTESVHCVTGLQNVQCTNSVIIPNRVSWLRLCLITAELVPVLVLLC